MKSLAWKLATVAAVVGVGFLVMLQAQRGMNRSLLSKSSDPQAAAATPDLATPADTKKPTDAAPPDPFDAAPAHTDSKVAGEPKALPTLADEKPAPPKEPLKTADNSTPPNAAGGPVPPANDPFADGGDAKPAPTTGQPSKPTAVAQLPVKQASGTAGENPLDPKSSADANSRTPATAGTPGPAGTEPPLLDQNEPKATPGKPASPGTTTPPTLTDAKSDGPQLGALGARPQPNAALPGAGETPPGPKTSKDATNGPNLPSGAGPGTDAQNPLDDTKKPSNAPASVKAGGEPSPFPDLDSPTGTSAPKTGGPALGGPPALPAPTLENPAKNGPANSPAASPQNEKTGDNGAKLLDGPSAGPSPFPAGGAAKEVPAPKSSNADNVNVHPEPNGDFQGDGTIGEQAPLGQQRPQLNIEKVAPQNALLGQPLVYSILVKNVGTSEARDVVVEDRIPRTTKLSGTIPRAELTGKKLSWKLGNLGPGEQRKISIRVVPLEPGEIGSMATVNFVVEAAAETVITAPRLEFEISAAQTTAKLGDQVPFHFKVKNVGTGEARGVVIRDVIPEGFSHAAGSDLEYEVGRLPSGKSKELTLDLKAVKVGPSVNRALAMAEGGISVKAEASIEIVGSKVSLTHTGPSRRYLGRPAVYTNTLVNESKYAVEGIAVVETVPRGLEFAGASHGGQYNDGTRTIAWRIDRMAPGETRVVKSKLTPIAVGNQMSAARVSVPNGEPIESTCQTVVEGFAALGLDVPAIDGPVDVGQQITLRVNARNKGTVSATNLVVTVDIPEQMAIVSARGPGKHVQEGNRVRFGPVPTLEGRTAATCELVLEARKRGDSRIGVSLQADHLDKPLTHEESVIVLTESADSPKAN